MILLVILGIAAGMSAGAITASALYLLCRAGKLHCALAARDIVETMRPLPHEELPGGPDFVIGLSVIRGEALPVVSVARLLSQPSGDITRFVTVRVGMRKVALAVDTTIGFRALSQEQFGHLPPLIGNASSSAVAQIAMLDGELLAVLGTIGIVPDAVFDAITAAAGSE